MDYPLPTLMLPQILVVLLMLQIASWDFSVELFIYLFIYLGFNVAFNTVQVISRQVVGRAEETST